MRRMRNHAGGVLTGLALLAGWTGGCGHDAFVPGRACVPGESRACYSGPPGTEDVGPCTGGVQACRDDASAWGPCSGEVTPRAETCATEEDDDCDGARNEDGDGCACAPVQTMACYEGMPASSEGVGACHGGQRACAADGTFGPCAGQVTPRLEDCDAAADEDCDGVVCSAPIWGLLFGDPAGGGLGDQEGRAVAVGPDGSLFAAIDFAGSIRIGETTLTSTGAKDIAVVKLSPAGAVAWAVAIGGEKDELSGGLAVDGEGHAVLFGTFFSATLDLGTELISDGSGSDAFVAKLGAASGAPLWARRAGVSGSFRAGAVAVAAEGPLGGDVVIAGTFSGTLVCKGASCIGGSVESASPEAFVQKLAGDGSGERWTKTAGGPGADSGDAVAVSADGTIVVGGSVTTDQAAFDQESLATSGPGDKNGFAARLSQDGEVLWAHGFGDGASQGVTAVAVASSGAIALGGVSQGAMAFGAASLPALPAQAFVAKLSADGVGVWARGYPGAGTTYTTAVAFDLDGNVVAAGRFQGELGFGAKLPLVAGQIDGFLLKLDQDGGYRWARGFGGAVSPDGGYAVAAAPAGEVIFAGAFTGAVDFGLGQLVAKGQSADAGVVLFEP